MIEYKICVCGPTDSGKTSFIKKIIDGSFSELYEPTKYPELHYAMYNTNYGNIAVNIWDVTNGLNYIKDADAVMIFISYDKIDIDITKFVEFIKMVDKLGIKRQLVVTKCDNDVINTKFESITYISVKNNINVDEPFLKALRSLQYQNLKVNKYGRRIRT